MTGDGDLKAQADQMIPDDSLALMPPHLRADLEQSEIRLRAFYQEEYRYGQGLIRRFATQAEALIKAVRARGADATTEALAKALETVIADARARGQSHQARGAGR